MNYNVKNPVNMPKAALFAIKNWEKDGISNPDVTPIFGIKMFGGNVYVFKEESNLVMCVLETNGEFGTIDMNDFIAELNKDNAARDAYFRELLPALFVTI